MEKRKVDGKNWKFGHYLTKPKAWYQVALVCRTTTQTLNIGTSGSGWMNLTLVHGKNIHFPSHQITAQMMNQRSVLGLGGSIPIFIGWLVLLKTHQCVFIFISKASFLTFNHFMCALIICNAVQYYWVPTVISLICKQLEFFFLFLFFVCF